MPQKVLVPVDHSEQSTAALEFAIDNYPRAILVALHAIDPGDFPTGGFEAGAFTDLERFRESYREEAEALLENATELAAETAE